MSRHQSTAGSEPTATGNIPGRRRLLPRLALAVFALLLALAMVEGLLRVLDLPRFYRAHSAPPQFAFMRGTDGAFVYVNLPRTTIRFEYDGNPRGYFGLSNEVDHVVNAAGFRGPEFSLRKPPRTLRLAFLGDSFTFGEGVRFEHTLPEQVARELTRRLAPRGIAVESLNFGVGGYNTEQELETLTRYVQPVHPDAVVVVFTLNDAEPRLFAVDPVTGEPMRRPRETAIGEGLDETRPPATFLYRFRIATLTWKFLAGRRRSAQTADYYKGLYAPEAAGWRKTRAAFDGIQARCRQLGLPCVVAIYPVLYHLRADYPFLDLHRQVQDAAQAAGLTTVDLLPAFAGRDATALWVHPTDQHPNEVAHGLAAARLVERLMQDPSFQTAVDRVVSETSGGATP